MNTMTAARHDNTHLLSPIRICTMASRLLTTRLLAVLLVFFVCVFGVSVAYVNFQPTALTHPDFDAAALSGTPQVDRKYGFSTLTVNDDYSIQLCGAPAFAEQSVDLYLTNPAGNKVWFRAEILDADGNLLAASGVLKQNQHLPSISFEEPLPNDKDIELVVRIIGYEPNTWHSAGTVSLKMVLSSD